MINKIYLLNLRKKFAQEIPFDYPEPYITKQELIRLYKQEAKGIYDEELENAIIAGFIDILEKWIEVDKYQLNEVPEFLSSRDYTNFQKRLEINEYLIQILQSAKTPQEKMIAIDRVINTAHLGLYGDYLIKDFDDLFFDELSNLKVSSSLSLRKKSYVMYNDKGQKFEVSL